MDPLKDIANHGAAATETVSSVYVPSVQVTEGQPSPIAANGGLSYMAFDQDGDAGTAAATEAAFIQIAEGEGQAVIDRLDNAPPGPIETKWGVGFRDYSECLEHIRSSNIEAPEGGLAVPLCYSIYEQPSYGSSRPTHCGGTRRARPRQKRCVRPSRTTSGDASIFRR